MPKLVFARDFEGGGQDLEGAGEEVKEEDEEVKEEEVVEEGGRWTNMRILNEPNKFTCAKELVIIIDTCKRLG